MTDQILNTNENTTQEDLLTCPACGNIHTIAEYPNLPEKCQMSLLVVTEDMLKALIENN